MNILTGTGLVATHVRCPVWKSQALTLTGGRIGPAVAVRLPLLRGKATIRKRFWRLICRRLLWVAIVGNSIAASTATGTFRSQVTTQGGKDVDESSQVGRKRGTYVAAAMPRMIRKTVR
jgi:hypothetical protein